MDQGRSRPRTEPAMNDIIWQNCSKYSSHAEILIAHMGNCIPRASQTHWNNTFAVPVIVTLSTHSQWLQHADNTCCVWNTRWGGIIKKIEWKIEQYCALPGMMFCREYLIFSPSARPPSSKSTRSLSHSTHDVPQLQTWNKKATLQSNDHPSHRANTFPYDISISVRFLMIFSNNHSVISNKLYQETDR